MILAKLNKSPEKLSRFSMIWLVAGLLLLAMGTAWPRLVLPAAHLSTGTSDFFHGMCLAWLLRLKRPLWCS